MKLEILSKSDRKIQFLVEGIDTELANALRRLILTEVPAFAIDEVIFIDNSTALYDEIIAHRLGLIPLTTDLDSFVLPERCDCEGVGCEKCQVSLQCSVTARDTNLNLYSSDLLTNDERVKPVSDKILITKMPRGSKLVFEAYARLGLGKVHAKWQPVSRISYKMYPSVTIDNDKLKDWKFKDDNENCPIVHICPKKILKWEKGKLVVTDEATCTLCGACYRADFTPEGAIDVKPVKNKFLFALETPGIMPPERILKEAFRIFQEKTQRFGNLIKQIAEKQEANA